MSLLSSLGGLGLEKGIFIKLQVPNIFEKLFSAIKNIYSSFISTLRKLSMGETFEIQENWTYQTDREKGIEVLQVEIDRLALRKTRNALRDLFY